MHKTVLQEVASAGVDLQGLLEGRGSCFIRVHGAAIVGLIASQDEYLFPKTLGLNKYQLGVFGAEFHYLSVSSAMLINFAKVLSGVNSGLKVMSRSWTFFEDFLPPRVPLTHVDNVSRW